jgi:hypothetical protein
MKGMKCIIGILALLVLGQIGLVNGQSFLTDGLVSFYPFDGNAKDAVGTNDGTVTGAVLAPDMFGRRNRAYYFRGTNAWILCPDTNFPKENDARTVSLWVNFSSYGTPQIADTPFITYGNGGANDTFYAILYAKSRENFPIYVGKSGGGDTPVWFGTQTNTWYNVLFSHDGTQTKLYINGELKGTAQRTYNTILNGEFYIGSYTHRFGWTESSPTMHGFIDNVRVYNRALSEEEVSQLFAFESAASISLDIEVASVRIKWSSEPNSVYQIQWSSALQDWTPLETVNGTGDNVEYVDAVAGEERFYRVVKQ